MFWNWVTAEERRDLALRSERITETIRLAFEERTLDRAPRELVEELLAAAKAFAAVAPKDFASVVTRGEQLLEQLQPYLRAEPRSAGPAPRTSREKRVR